MILLALAALLCALVPAGIFWANLRAYRAPALLDGRGLPRVSILIPARNEEETIAVCLEHALASTGVAFEIVVMDDSSTDRTAEIVRSFATRLPPGTLRLAVAPALPDGWNGKQHACWQLALAARYPLLCFVDADVRLAPEAAARMAQFLVETRSGLVSGFPRQETVTWLEQLLLPLIHFVLLGFLPISQMRRHVTNPGYGAGCGQFLLVEHDAYFRCGGHAAIRTTMHDGIKLPRLIRKHGGRTDLADLTELATCRMYTNAREVWQGLAKNAVEGMASPRTIVPATALLLLGQVTPFLLLAAVPSVLLGHAMGYYARPRSISWTPEIPVQIWMMAICGALAVCAVWLPRFLAVRRFRQPLLSAILHPVGILTLLGIQWYALARHVAGAPIPWRARSYKPSESAD